MIKLSFKAGSVNENEREKSKYMKFVCSKCHIAGSLKEIQKEYKIQPDLMKDEINHNISNYKEYESSWKLYLIDDVLGLAYLVVNTLNISKKLQVYL